MIFIIFFNRNYGIDHNEKTIIYDEEIIRSSKLIDFEKEDFIEDIINLPFSNEESFYLCVMIMIKDGIENISNPLEYYFHHFDKNNSNHDFRNRLLILYILFGMEDKIKTNSFLELLQSTQKEFLINNLLYGIYLYSSYEIYKYFEIEIKENSNDDFSKNMVQQIDLAIKLNEILEEHDSDEFKLAELQELKKLISEVYLYWQVNFLCGQLAFNIAIYDIALSCYQECLSELIDITELEYVTIIYRAAHSAFMIKKTMQSLYYIEKLINALNLIDINDLIEDDFMALINSLDEDLYEMKVTFIHDIDVKNFYIWVDIYEKFITLIYGEDSIELIKFNLEIGDVFFNEFINAQSAYSYYGEAEKLIKVHYGNSHKFCNIIKMYTYIPLIAQKRYKEVLQNLSDAGNMIWTLKKEECIDDWMLYVYDHKDELLKSISSAVLMYIKKIDDKNSYPDMLPLLIGYHNDFMGLLHKALFEPLGLPRKFDFMEKYLKEIFFSEYDEKDLSAVLLFMQSRLTDGKMPTKEEKESIIRLFQKFIPKFVSAAQGTAFEDSFNDTKNNINEVMYSYFMENKDARAEKIIDEMLERQSEDTLLDQITMKHLKCLNAIQHNEKENAKELIIEILDIVQRLSMQVFLKNSVYEQLSLIESLNSIRTWCIPLVQKIYNNTKAYEEFLKNRALTIYYRQIQLNDKIDEKLAIAYLNGESLDRYQESFVKRSQNIFGLTVDDVKSKLKNNEMLIECSEFNNNTKVYGIFLIDNRYLNYIELTNIDEIKESLSRMMEFLKEYQRTRRIEMNTYSSIQQSLYHLVVEPVFRFIPENIKRIYFAPDDLFDYIPLSLFPSLKRLNTVVTDDYEIYYVLSGKGLLREDTPRNNHKIYFMGNPCIPNNRFKPLPASKKFLNQMKKLYDCIVLEQSEMCLENIKKDAKVLHISTHSYTYKNENNFNNRGLIFHNSNFVNLEKLRKLPLNNTELVVLDICGSFDEDYVQNEGIIGIHRAFLESGAHYVIHCLWESDDLAGALLFEQFYKYYLDDALPCERALYNAVKDLQKITVKDLKNSKYWSEELNYVFDKDEVRPYIHPYYWAGYVVSSL